MATSAPRAAGGHEGEEGGEGCRGERAPSSPRRPTAAELEQQPAFAAEETGRGEVSRDARRGYPTCRRDCEEKGPRASKGRPGLPRAPQRQAGRAPPALLLLHRRHELLLHRRPEVLLRRPAAGQEVWSAPSERGR
ncbi:unnamed protein product [Urochloa humidicola]